MTRRGPFSRSLSILIYHRVIREPDPLRPDEVSGREFEAQMRVLRRWFRVLPLCESVARLRDGTLPARAAAITFDDGYADNVEVALPILTRLGLPATVFLATDYIDGGAMWNDTVIETVRRARTRDLDCTALGLGKLDLATVAARRKAISSLLAKLKYLPAEERSARIAEFSARVPGEQHGSLMVTSDQVRALRRSGVEIGAHTLSHPILAKLEAAGAEFEIAESKRRLESITGAAVRIFAYPNGVPGRDYRSEHVAMVRNAGFEAAVSTAWGVANADSDAFQLPRFTPWDRSQGGFLLRLLHNTFRVSAARV